MPWPVMALMTSWIAGSMYLPMSWQGIRSGITAVGISFVVMTSGGVTMGSMVVVGAGMLSEVEAPALTEFGARDLAPLHVLYELLYDPLQFLLMLLHIRHAAEEREPTTILIVAGEQAALLLHICAAQEDEA